METTKQPLYKALWEQMACGNSQKEGEALQEFQELAMQNMVTVADCLQRLMDFTINKDSGEYLDTLLNDCEEALNLIS